MADDDGKEVITKEVHIPPDVTKADLEAQKKVWEQHRKEIKDEIAELHAGDKAEREELKLRLEHAEEVIDKYQKAEEEREKIKDSSHTMVLPPKDIPPQQPNVSQESQQQSQSGGTPERKKRLRGW